MGSSQIGKVCKGHLYMPFQLLVNVTLTNKPKGLVFNTKIDIHYIKSYWMDPFPKPSNY